MSREFFLVATRSPDACVQVSLYCLKCLPYVTSVDWAGGKTEYPRATAWRVNNGGYRVVKLRHDTVVGMVVDRVMGFVEYE